MLSNNMSFNTATVSNTTASSSCNKTFQDDEEKECTMSNSSSSSQPQPRTTTATTGSVRSSSERKNYAVIYDEINELLLSSSSTSSSVDDNDDKEEEESAKLYNEVLTILEGSVEDASQTIHTQLLQCEKQAKVLLTKVEAFDCSNHSFNIMDDDMDMDNTETIQFGLGDGEDGNDSITNMINDAEAALYRTLTDQRPSKDNKDYELRELRSEADALSEACLDVQRELTQTKDFFDKIATHIEQQSGGILLSSSSSSSSNNNIGCTSIIVGQHLGPLMDCNPIVSSTVLALSDVYEGIRSLEEEAKNANATTTKSKDDGWVAPSTFERTTSKYWIQTNMLPSVLTTVVKEAPLLVYGRKANTMITTNDEKSNVTHLSDQDKLWSSGNLATTISSVYYDSPSMDMYRDRIARIEGAQLFRIRWYGSNKPIGTQKVFLELKTHHEKWINHKSIKERVTIQEQDMELFLTSSSDSSSGKDKKWKYDPSSNNLNNEIARSIVQRGNPKLDSEGVELQKQVELICRMQNLVIDMNLQPCVRSCYQRAAFQSSNSNSLRLTIDRNVTVIDETSRARSSTSTTGSFRWCLSDDEAKDPTRIKSVPYSIFEVKLSGVDMPTSISNLIEDEHSIMDAYKFSKFLTGAASFQQDNIKTMPYWADHEQFQTMFGLGEQDEDEEMQLLDIVNEEDYSEDEEELSYEELGRTTNHTTSDVDNGYQSSGTISRCHSSGTISRCHSSGTISRFTDDDSVKSFFDVSNSNRTESRYAMREDNTNNGEEKEEERRQPSKQQRSLRPRPPSVVPATMTHKKPILKKSSTKRSSTRRSSTRSFSSSGSIGSMFSRRGGSTSSSKRIPKDPEPSERRYKSFHMGSLHGFDNEGRSHKSGSNSNNKKRLAPKKAVRVEPKSYFANERTFIQWISAGLLLVTVAAIIAASDHPHVYPIGLFLLSCAAFVVVYSMYVYHRRLTLMRSGAPYGYVDRMGPLLLAAAVLVGVIILLVNTVKTGGQNGGSAAGSGSQTYLVADDETGKCHQHPLNGVNRFHLQPSDALVDTKRHMMLIPSLNNIFGIRLADDNGDWPVEDMHQIFKMSDAKADFEAVVYTDDDRIFAVWEGELKTQLVELEWTEDDSNLKVIQTYWIHSGLSEGAAFIDGELYIVDNNVKEDPFFNGGIQVYDIPDRSQTNTTPEEHLNPTRRFTRKVLNEGLVGDTKIGALHEFEGKLYVLHDNLKLVRVWDPKKGILLEEIKLPAAKVGAEKQWEGFALERRMVDTGAPGIDAVVEKAQHLRGQTGDDSLFLPRSSKLYMHMALDSPPQVWSLEVTEDEQGHIILPSCANGRKP